MTRGSDLALSVHDGVWTMRLARPERRNVLDAGMRTALADAVAEVAADDDARGVVVTAEGPVFCAGADLPELFGDAERDVAATRRALHEVYRSFLGLRDLAVPTIAAIDGPAIGAGLNLAMACDVRVMGPAGALSAVFSKIGLHPGGGCTHFLVETMGRQAALALLLDGGTLDAPAAVARGLALEVAADAEQRAHAMARRWAALGTGLVRDLKRTVDVASTEGFSATLDLESWAQAASARGPRIQEELARFRRADSSAVAT